MKKLNSLLSPQTSIYLLPLLFLFLFSGCQKEALPEVDGLNVDPLTKAKDKSVRVNTYYGPAQAFNGGVVRAMVSMNEFGHPTHIGVKISEKVLEGIEDVDSQVITLQLPNKAAGLPFDHIDLDWNQMGHEPDFLYAVPHFDFHFFMVSEEYKMGMTDTEKAANLPEPQYVPAGYFLPAVELVPYMGVHWLSSAAPELGGVDFTHTFIFGSYDGEFIFYEPMITLDYLLNEADGEYFPIAEPQEYQHKGYFYPTNYSMDYDSGKKEYTIIMSGMRWIQ